MLEGAAKIVLNQLFEQLGREVGGPAAPEGAASAPARKPSLWQRLLALFGGQR